MTNLTIRLYRYFRSHRGLFYAILVATTVLFGWFASKVRLEEDITALLPPVESGGAEQLVFSNLEVKDKLFLLFHARTEEVWPEDLAEVCDAFVAQLMREDSALHTIKDIVREVDPALFGRAVGFLYDHAPTFLEAAHYARLDSLLSAEAIDARMEANYRELTASSGSGMAQTIRRDPVALRTLLLPAAADPSGQQGGESSGYTLYENHIFSKDHTLLTAYISPASRSYDSGTNTLLVELVERTIKQFAETNPEVEILYHGAPVQSVGNSRRIKADLMLTVGISLALIVLLLLACFRNKRTILYLICPVGYGVLFALATIALTRGSMSLMALGIGAIVMGVAFSYCLHLITHFKYVSDPEQVLRDQTVPVFLGSLTTIGAFSGLLLTDSELLRDFGLFASLGLIGTTLFCLLFLPQFFSPEANKRPGRAFAILERVSAYPLERRRWLIGGLAVVSIVCIFASRYVRFDANLSNIGYNDPAMVRSQQLLEEKTSGGETTYHFAAVAGDLEAALRANERLSGRLEEQKAAGRIASYLPTSSLFVPQQEQQLRIARWSEYWNAERLGAVRERVLQSGARYGFAPNTFAPFFDLLDAAYEPVSLYGAGIVPDELLANVIEYNDGRYIVFTPVRMEPSALDEVGRAVTADEPELVVVSPMFYAAEMVKRIHADFNTAVWISSLFVLAVLLLAYGSVVLALIAFLPMTLGWYIVLGTMALTGMEFNLINIVVSAFIFGVGVDYSIFIMDGLLGRHRDYASLLLFHKTCITISAIILVVVISSLLFARHPAIASIGVSTLIGMSATILLAYSLQPWLFGVMTRVRTRRGKSATPAGWSKFRRNN